MMLLFQEVCWLFVRSRVGRKGKAEESKAGESVSGIYGFVLNLANKGHHKGGGWRSIVNMHIASMHNRQREPSIRRTFLLGMSIRFW